MPEEKGQNPQIPIKLGGALLLAFILSTGSSRDVFQKPRPLPAQASFDLGKSLRQKGDFERSLEAFGACLAFSPPGSRIALDCLVNMGILYWNMGRMDESGGRFRQSLQQAQKMGLEQESRTCRAYLDIQELFEQGLSAQSRGELRTSNESFQKALGLAESVRSPAHELKVLRNWSLNFLGASGQQKYLEMNEKAAVLAQSLNHRAEIIKTHKNLAVSNFAKKSYSQSLSHFFKVLDAARMSGNQKEVLFCLSNVALAYNALGDPKKAIEYYGEALKDRESMGSESIQSAFLNNLAVVHRWNALSTGNADHFHKAIDLFTQSAELARKKGDESLEIMASSSLADVYIDLKQYDRALSCLLPAFEKAKKKTDPILSEMLQASLGLAYVNQGKWQEAERFFSGALRDAQKTGSGFILMKSLFGLGLCEEKRGNDARALDYMERAVRIVDEIGSRIVDDNDRASFIQKKLHIYQGLLDLYWKLWEGGRSELFGHQAFRAAELGKARSFLEFLERMDAPDAAQRLILLPSSKAEEKKWLDARLEQYGILAAGGLSREQKEETEARILKIEDRLKTLFSERYLNEAAKDAPGEAVPIDVLQNRLLGGSSLLLEYVMGETRSYLFVVSRESFGLVSLPPQDKIYDSVTAYLNFLKNPLLDRDKGRQAARRLYRELIGPVEGFVSSSVSNLIIVPDGILWKLPFESLIQEEPESGGESLLVEKFDVSYAPSASALARIMGQVSGRPYDKDLLAFGAPLYPKSDAPKDINLTSPSGILWESYRSQGYSINPLRHSSREIKDISRSFPREKKDLYLGRSAEERNLKSLNLRRYRIVHFACHAISDEVNPLRSALVLSISPEGKEDNFFQVLEMYQYRLESELTVLSACKTGEGKTLRNEGVLGLPRLFFYMGSRAVVSSLWNIDDKASARFMRYFYEGLRGGMGKSQALRSAKLRMIRAGYGHPYYWAAFILTGDSRTPVI